MNGWVRKSRAVGKQATYMGAISGRRPLPSPRLCCDARVASCGVMVISERRRAPAATSLLLSPLHYSPLSSDASASSRKDRLAASSSSGPSWSAASSG